MKRTSFIIAALFTSLMFSAQSFSVKAKSGDTELDASLDHINVKAKADLPLFKDEVALEFNIGKDKVDNMLKLDLSPADVYMTLEVAEQTKKDPDVVLASYQKNKDKGWGAIAKDMGIKPGSAEFHALKGKAKNKKDKGGKGKDKGEGGNGKGNGKGKGKNK